MVGGNRVKHNRHKTDKRQINQNRSAKAATQTLQSSQLQTPKKTCSQQTGQNERVENTVEGKTEAGSYRIDIRSQ